ncbi:MAG: glycosyltransferase [bacterium]
MRTIIHVVRDLEAQSGGPSRSVPALVQQLAQSSEDQIVVLYCRGPNTVTLPSHENLVFLGLPFLGLGIARQIRRLLVENQLTSNVVLHLHGIWSPIIHLAARFAQRHAIPYVVSTRGMLAEWCLDHKSFKKKLAWSIYQRKDLANASALVATSGMECLDVQRQLPDARVVEIPNGCDIDISVSDVAISPLLDTSCRWGLFLGRLHPVKGIDKLLSAWATLPAPDWCLAIAGPNEDNYGETLERLVNHLNLGTRVEFLGPVEGDTKRAIFSQCEFLAAPSESENFGMSIAEGLGNGLPVIASKGTPWSQIDHLGCGWWVDSTVEDLRRVLEKVSGHTSNELAAMGEIGKQLINEQFSWRSVANRCSELYESILRSGSRSNS